MIHGQPYSGSKLPTASGRRQSEDTITSILRKVTIEKTRALQKI